jgi:hypothetical protein
MAGWNKEFNLEVSLVRQKAVGVIQRPIPSLVEG